jgi:tetratricopeptide (TPR) repeat protein
MFQDHPTAEEYAAFLRDASHPSDARRDARILRHLLAACSTCRGQLQEMGWTSSRLERLVHLPGSTCDFSLEENGYCYDRAFARSEQAVIAFLSTTPPPQVPIDQLLAELDRANPDDRLTLVEEDRFAIPRLVQALIDRSHASRYADPEAMLHWALLARSVSGRCMPESLGNSAKLADLRAHAWGQCGNALRVASRPQEAEEAMITAQRYLQTGTGDPDLKARLCELNASLQIFQRRFEAAIMTLGQATEIYRSLGEIHGFARTLVQQAIAFIYAGNAERAVEQLNRAIPLIDHEEDPHLLLAACHNLVQCYIDLGQPEQALSIYSEARTLYKEFSDSVILLRAGWHEGQILRDLGHLRAAESALLRARTGFMERGMMHEVAVVCLDLAAVYVKLKAVDDLKQTVTATVPIFRALRVDREALASLLQLQQVADNEAQAMELFRFLNARIEMLTKQRGLLK